MVRLANNDGRYDADQHVSSRNLAYHNLGEYLEGKPDTPDWRRILSEQVDWNPHLNWTPIKHEGRIIPRWALEDYYALVEGTPELGDTLLKGGRISVPGIDSILES